MDKISRERIEYWVSQKGEKPKVIVIYGPTACGKTALSLELASFFETEIISVDSRQIYQWLDIGTGKISKEEMKWIIHHMIDIVDPSVTFSMVDFREMALPIMRKLQDSGKIPILCGGTGLYIDGLLYEMAIPDSVPDWEYRKELENFRQKEWNLALWHLLEKVDPAYAHELEVNNYRYVMRWLEVWKETGKSKRESQNTRTPRFDTFFLCPYDGDREALYERINWRIDEMFLSWLVDEVWYNIRRFTSSAPGLNTIGYKEVIGYLEWKMMLNECISLVKQHNRNYAKRQITWNKKYE